MKIRIVLAILVTVVLLIHGNPVSISAQTGSNSATASLGLVLGVYQPPTVNYGTELNSFNALVGKKHVIAMYYVNWATQFDPFLQNQVNNQMAAADRPVIMVAWEPTGGLQKYGCDRDYGFGEAVPWDVIIQGGCDSYIHSYARAMKQRSERFLIKFAHEMNGGGTAWSPVVIGIHPDKYIMMWRHVHDIFTAEGVTNVEWVWAPIYRSHPNTAENSLYNYYPGGSYVDWVGLSGYNYYNQMPSGPQPWRSFDKLFGAGLRELACRYAKPQMIHEMSSIEDNQGVYSKSAWIADAYQAAQNYPLLRAVVWFNDVDYYHPSVDFRVTSSTAGSGNVHALPETGNAWTNAYKNALAASAYKTTLPTLTVATPPATYCGSGETVFTADPNVVILEPGQSSKHTLTGMMYSSATNLSLSLPAKITGSVAPGQLLTPWGEAQITLQTSATIAPGTYTVIVQAGSMQVPIKVMVVNSVQHAYLPLVLR